ncbi:hypothetical protein P154DRAFT_528069 [Amniculicola lignicola CBS 123094]|uniref:HD domain-containing protein n=1 Tax=Amniculicola lignicola CBS 123094 TaxID=1392246 RepID=A0A6A5VWL2_9PLEO|nr:hypothetical protein P154DRAFT_528069 [Amniculicola lignicola CBS 123094]
MCQHGVATRHYAFLSPPLKDSDFFSMSPQGFPSSGLAQGGREDFNATGTLPADAAPATPIAKKAFELASSTLHPSILNHSIRVYQYAEELAQRSDSIFLQSQGKHDLLFAACILHDIGTVSQYDGPQRFEVEGADAAVALLREFGASDEDAHEVWVAIALHTSPGIAERITPLAKLVREAVLMDFGRINEFFPGEPDEVTRLRATFESIWERRDIEQVLGDSVVHQAIRRPGKAPAASWPNNLYRAHLADPEWKGVNKGF